MDPVPSFWARVVLAFVAFFKVLLDASLAARVRGALTPGPPPALAEKPAPARLKEPAPAVDHHAPALHLLSMLQREGRLIDFVQEDVAGAGDADVGAAARIVHDGCRKVIAQYITLEPVVAQDEETPITVEPGFDPGRIRLTGNVVGHPPFKGQLKHKGWKATGITLPPPPKEMDATVIAPAEVEL